MFKQSMIAWMLLGAFLPGRTTDLNMVQQAIECLRGLPLADILPVTGDFNPEDLLDGEITRKGKYLYLGNDIRFKVGKTIKAKRGGVTQPPKRHGGIIDISIGTGFNNTLWQMKDTVIHELVHAAFAKKKDYGYYSPSGKLISGQKFKKKYKSIHERVCYLTNLRLLYHLKTLPQFAGDLAGIEARIKYKKRYVEVNHPRKDLDKIGDHDPVKDKLKALLDSLGDGNERSGGHRER